MDEKQDGTYEMVSKRKDPGEANNLCTYFSYLPISVLFRYLIDRTQDSHQFNADPGHGQQVIAKCHFNPQDIRVTCYSCYFS